LFIIFAATLTI